MAARLKALGPRSETDLVAEELAAWAEVEGLPHAFEGTPGGEPAERFIRSDGLTEVGRALVGFLASTPWDEMAEPLRAESLAIVRESVREGALDFETGWLVFRPPRS